MSSTITKRAASTVSHHRQRFLRTALPYVVTALLTSLFCGYVFDLRHHDLRLPIEPPIGDYLFSATVVKGVMQHGWHTSNPMVGAPHGLDFHDFPMAEGLHFVFYHLAGILHVPVVLAMNLHYLLGYVLIALTSLYVFLAYRLPLAPSMAASLLFAFMPHHWMPGQAHLMLSSYYMIPLSVLAVLWLADGEEFLQYAPAKWYRWRFTRKGLAAAAICALTGSAGIYYAVFAIAFFAITAAFRLASRPTLAQVLSGLMPMGVIAVFVILNTSPTIFYWLRNGTNHMVAARNPAEANIYGLKIVQLLMPIVNHRVPLLAHWKSSYLALTNPYVPNNDTTASLGVIAGFGFLCLVAWLLFGREDRTRLGERLTHLSILNISAVLIATIGGFGSIFALAVSPEIRVYARISIYIAFFSLFGLLVILRRVEALWPHSKQLPRLLHLAIGAGMFASLWDITPATLALAPASQATVQNDRDFIHSIEAAVPTGSMIFQLPYHPFPEHGYTNKMLDYDPFRSYLYSDRLRWSYGAMKGRPADTWQRTVASLPVAQMLNAVVEAGFQGIYIDRYGYSDAAAEISSGLNGLLAERPLQSADGRLLFFSLLKYSAGVQSGPR